MNKYTFSGMSLPVKAQVVGEHLTKLYEDNEGRLTAEMVLGDAKKKRSPIHSCFEWDDKEAAEKFRITQARDMIRKIKVVIQDDDKRLEVKSFVSVRTNEQGELTTNFMEKGNSFYVRVEDAMSDETLRGYTLDSAMLEMKNFIRKYEDLMELSDVVTVMKQKLKKSA